MYDPVEDGRHIVTMDLPKTIKMSDLEKELSTSLPDQHKAPLSKKVSEYLQKEKRLIDMNAIWFHQM